MHAGYLYLQPGQEPSNCQDVAEAEKAAAEGVCFVLGAGNQGFLGLYDTLHAMFYHGHVACLKYHDTQVLHPRKRADFRLVGLASGEDGLFFVHESCKTSSRAVCLNAQCSVK